MKTDIYNQKGEKIETLELPEAVFSLPWNQDLVHQVVVGMQANQRVTIAHAKGRGEVSGGGKKPWRQKGTGRARQGSTRSPIWIGGGVTHGPQKEKDYGQKINKKMKRGALLTILSQKLRDNEILFIDNISLSEPKTKLANEVFKSVSKISGFEKLVSKKKNRAIIALPKKDEDTKRSFKNLPGTEIAQFKNLNALDLMTYKYLIISNPKEVLEGVK